MSKTLKWLLALVLIVMTGSAFAQQGISAVTVTTNPDGAQEYSMTLQALFIMTALSLIPAFVMMMTSFTAHYHRAFDTKASHRVATVSVKSDFNWCQSISQYVYHGASVR